LHLKRWFDAIKARPATRRAYARAAGINTTPIAGDEVSRKILFSQTAANEIRFLRHAAATSLLGSFIS